MTLPLSELPTQAQTKIRDELAERAINLIQRSPQRRISVADLIHKVAAESSRSEQEVLYVLQYMLYKGRVSEQGRTITEGKGSPAR